MRGSGLTTCSGLRKDVVNCDTIGRVARVSDQPKEGSHGSMEAAWMRGWTANKTSL